MSGYPNTLKYFMWPFQVHFAIHCQIKGESVFNQLDRGLTPRVMILGLDQDHTYIDFEPENLEYLKPAFKNLHDLKQQESNNHPRKNMFYSGPGMQGLMDKRIESECWKLAIERALNESVDGANFIFFVESSITLNDKNIYLVLSLNRQVYELHTHLKQKMFDEHFRIYRSLLETTVDAFLSECKRDLYLPEPGRDIGYNGRSAEELLRDAARKLTYTFSCKGDERKGLHGLYDACNTISIHKYEGKENLGSLIIASKDHQSINYSLRLEEPFDLGEYRKTRKMLQLAKDDVSVICNASQVLGLGTVKADYDPSTESIFFVKFRGIHCWEVWHDDKAILVMNYGVPQFLSEVIDKKIFYSDCRRIFSDINDNQIENLYHLSVAATKQKNGALLIISDNAPKEAERLDSQCLRIKPQMLTDDLLINLASIDGGVMVDREGIVYAHGVILDGVVSGGGDSSRGSRYNSAVTYIKHKGRDSKTLIVVVSEDGMVDIIPFLRPQISRSEIERIISVLKDQQSDFNRGTFNSAMRWLINRKFYLTKDQCDLINSIKTDIDNREFDAVRLVHEDIHPDVQLDESYFLD